MHTWRLVDVGVFFTFFWTPFCSAPYAFFFWTLCGFFLNLFWGPPYLFTPKDIFFPALPLF